MSGHVLVKSEKKYEVYFYLGIDSPLVEVQTSQKNTFHYQIRQICRIINCILNQGMNGWI